MHINRVGWPLVAGLLIGPATAYALGMGDIDVHSGLNQSLDAKIGIISDTAGELDRLQVSLAPRDAFERLGLERMPVLTNLQFDVVKSGPGAPYIQVSSTTPIREPFLDFVLSVSWANGQIFREYTVLLDPPVFDQSEAAPAVQAPASESSSVIRSADAFPAEPPRVSSPPQPLGSYGPTQRADTLWEVALELRSDASVSVPQMMLALLQENPEAFYANNINNLKAGYVLRAPDREVITALSKQAAAAETNRQYQEWLSAKGAAGATSTAGTRRQVVDDGATGPATASSGPASAGDSSSSGRLQLVSPEQALTAGGLGGASTDETIQSLRQQLAVATESAEASGQENLKLKEQLADLESQLESMQHLIALRDESLAALQEGLASAGQPETALPDAATSVAEQSAAQALTAQEGQTADSSLVASDSVQTLEIIEDDTTAESAQATAEPAPAVGTAEPAEQPAQPVTAPAQAAGVLDRLMADPKLMAIAVAIPILAIMLIVLILRRRKQDADEEDFFATAPLASENMDSSLSSQSAELPSTEPASADVAFGSHDEALPPTDSADDLFLDNNAETETFSGFGADAGAIHAEESDIDPIAEADVYLAYRRYEQAESLLKEAIAAEPDRNELKLKLLEIYFATKDQEAFEAQAEAIYATSSGSQSEVWDQVVEMGRELCPDHPLFAEAGGLPMSDDAASATESEFDLDFGDALSLDDGSASGQLSSEGLDLGLSDEIEPTAASASGESDSAASTLDDLDLELDLDFDSQLPGDDLLSTPELNKSKSDDVAKAPSQEGLADLSFDEFESDMALDVSNAEQRDGVDKSGVDFSEFDNVISLDKAAGTPKESGLEDLELDLDDLSLNRDVGSEFASTVDEGHTAQAAVARPSTAALSSGSENGDWALQPALSEFVDSDDKVGDEEYSLFENTDDVVGTKLDLAKAYIDMGDQDGALSILDEVVKEGSDTQREEAELLMRQIG